MPREAGTATLAGSASGPVRPRIVFLTGQSDPERCALSVEQAEMLAALADQATDIDCVPRNFPWHAETAPWRPQPLWRASLANARQYLDARLGRLAGSERARAWLLQAPRSLLLTGSCGLALLDTLVRDLADPLRARLRVVSYGAVAARWPRGIEGANLRGRRDWIAAALGPRPAPATRTLACGHMDYLQDPAAREAVLAASCEQLPWLRGGP